MHLLFISTDMSSNCFVILLVIGVGRLRILGGGGGGLQIPSRHMTA